MINELQKNGDLILQALKKEKQLTISDIERNYDIIRCQVRASIAYLLGADKIEELKIGMAKVYFLK